MNLLEFNTRRFRFVSLATVVTWTEPECLVRLVNKVEYSFKLASVETPSLSSPSVPTKIRYRDWLFVIFWIAQRLITGAMVSEGHRDGAPLR